MTASAVPSWLLGGASDWQTFLADGAVADPDGLRLTKTADDPAVRTIPPRPLPRYHIGGSWYDIDRAAHEVIAYTSDLRVRHRWILTDWDPVDVAGDEGCVFVLDIANQAIYSHTTGREALSPLVQSQDDRTRWTRITLDSGGYLLVFDSATDAVARYTRSGDPAGTVNVPWPPEVPPPGMAPAKQVATTQPRYPAEASWLSGPLDSSIYNCQWHRVDLDFADLPPGTQVEISTFSYASLDQAPRFAGDPRFVVAYTVVAPMQPPPDQRKKHNLIDVMIQGGPGEYLSLRVVLRGDTFSTPIVRSVRLTFPRSSYLAFLPPLYSANEPMRRFLEAYLSVTQAEWDGFDRRVEESSALFDVDTVPAGVAMTYLASWIGLFLEGTWDGDHNRQLLQAATKVYPHRGTLGALRDYLTAYIANMGGLTAEAVTATGFPAIVEAFRERQYLLLSQDNGSSLGTAQPLWSDEVVRRLQLGGLAREGDFELVSTGDPEHDFFTYFAHRFRVYVPAAWVKNAADERMLRRAIETEMPAHVSYDLCLVEPGIAVDTQSTVGVNTILGDAPAWQLPCAVDDLAPGRLPEHELGTGTFLARGRMPRPAVLDQGARVGGWTLD